MRPRLARPANLGRVNVTPLIDVLLCLIVFALITSQIAADAGSLRGLPVSSTSAEATPKAPQLTILQPQAATPRYLVAGRELTAAQAEEVLRKLLESPDAQGIARILAPATADSSRILAALGVCSRAGARVVELAVLPNQGPTP